MKKLVIAGGGFAGMWAAMVAAREVALANGAVSITLVSRDAFLTVRPRLYEAFGEHLRAPLASTLGPLGVAIETAEIAAIDTTARHLTVQTTNGAKVLSYDRLVLATGSQQRPLAVSGAAEFALNIDTFAGAGAFDEALRQRLAATPVGHEFSVVVIGGGFTGIELATEMRRRIAQHAGAEHAASARITLLERASVVGPELGAGPREVIEAALRDGKVEVRLGCSLNAIDANGVVLQNGERVPASMVVVTTGLQAEALAPALPGEHDALGRALVDEHLRVRAVPEVFAAGDVAHALTDPEHAALMSCQHAVPMGKHAGYNAARELLGLPLRTYRQPGYVTCLDLGDYGAVLTVGWDRKVEQFGPDVKALKHTINQQWIYPPTGSREALLVASDIDAPWPPET